MRYGRLLLLAGTLIAAPASAHWQFTRWGMTPEQVQAASPTVQLGENRSASSSASRVLASAPYSANGMSFDVRFGFDAGRRLNKVSLELADLSQCTALNAALRSVYGEPMPGDRSPVYFLARWRDERGGNMVNLLAIGGLGRPDTCSVDYQPIRSREESGL